MKAGSYIEGAVVGERSIIGPYAHLRPETVIGDKCRIGNFVETKKINMKNESKASHLTYLGDAEIGSKVNIGCGTVTCNYGVDKKKRKTKIGDKAFIGSGAPISSSFRNWRVSYNRRRFCYHKKCTKKKVYPLKEMTKKL